MNLEGLRHIFPTLQDGIVIGPWFFTNIMACYLLLVLYQKIEEKHSWADKIFCYGGVFPLIVFILFGMLQISIQGVLTFFIGMVLKKRELLEKPRKQNWLIALAAFVLAVGCRLIGKRFLDETVFYNNVLSLLTHIVIAASLLVGVKWLFGMIRGLNRIVSGKAFRFLDTISIYVYVCHGMFITPIFSQPIPLGLRLLEFFAVILATATLMHLIGKRLTAYTERAVQYLFL